MSEAEQSRDTAQEPQRDTQRSVAGNPEGRLLAGRYRLGEVLGRGGMGTVWRALDETLGRTVAVKELRFPSSIDDDEKRRLITRTLREAKAIARIRNSGAVTVYDVVDEDDRPWIVMELIEGKSLAELVREDGVLTPERAAEVGLAILDVLRSAHREGILHRDVKPSNVLMSEDGRVVLTDFGIAQVEGDPSVTSTGMLVGAPSYISPERARGHKPGPAADLWSLGGLLYASVEGSPPYDKGSAIATLTAVMTEPVGPPKNAGALTEVIYGLLVKDPAQRLDDAGARALLQDVIKVPQQRNRAQEPEPGPEATRVVPLPPAPAKAVKPARPEGGATSDRMLGALRSVRNATARPETKAKQERTESPSPPPPPRASLTDVVPRRTLVIIAVVAALAVIATVLAVSLRGGSDSKDSGTPESSAASSGATASDGASTGPQEEGRSEAPGQAGEATSGSGKTEGPSDEPSTSADPSGAGGAGGSKENTGSAGGLPAGYAMVTDSQFHFSMAMPKGFKKFAIAGINSGGIYSVAGGFPRIQGDYTRTPTNDAKKAWELQEKQTRGTFNDYQLISIRSVDYNGYPTVADWEFKDTLKGVRVHVLNRGFKIDSTHGYAIVVTCEDSEWNGAECRTLRETAFGTFKPKD